MPRGVKYSEKQKQQMVVRFLAGARVADVAAEFGCSVPTVAGALRAHGVPPRRGPGSIRKGQRTEHVKHCKECDTVKPIEDFYKGSGRVCKACVIARSTARRRRVLDDADPAEKARLYAATNRAALARKYGLTVEEAEKLYGLDACQICGKPADPGKVHNIDHDHTTGKVRGLLCSPCNRGLGFFRDDPELLAAAVLYLKSSLLS